MGFIHGLAVFLIIFEGIIIIRCNGTDTSEDKTSLNWTQDAPVIEISEDKQLLPNHLIEGIIMKSDFKTAQRAVRSRVINATSTVMNSILRDRIILIVPHSFDGETREYYEGGDLFIKFGSYQGLVSLFDQFGDLVKKIEIFYSGARSLHSQINHNIINRCANNLEELRIRAFDEVEIWEEISNGDNGISFPELKKFQFNGVIYRKEFKLHLIFPKLESFKLNGFIGDMNCLANVTTLKELKLMINSIPEHQLNHIFANNKNMTLISLQTPMMAETMHAIAKNLMKLETLEVKHPGGSFLFRSIDSELYNLPSVTHFHVLFYGLSQLIGDLSFDMPHLKKLRLEGRHIDIRIIKFINHFKELETVELLVNGYDPVDCIEKLKHIKEFMVNDFENRQLNSLRKMFERFDDKSKLQTLKLLNFRESYRSYEHSMRAINICLARSNKPTWTLSQGEQNGTGRKYLMFKRELRSTCMS